jgi:hypothetical protein
MTRPRILLYAERNLHLPFLEPVFDHFVANNEAEVAFSAPVHIPVTDDHVGIGLPDETIDRLRQKGEFYSDPSTFEPDIIVVADCCFYRLYDGPKFVNLGHGMICKGTFYNTSKIVRRENLADLICTPGAWHKKRLQQNVFSPIVATGFIKSDQVYGKSAPTREEFLAGHGIDAHKKVILLAPTYNEELSALPCIAERLGELAQDNNHLLIKLHGMTSPRWRNVCAVLAQANSNVKGYAGAFVSADMLISDVSSIYVEFMGQDKPIVLYNNPKRYGFSAFRDDDIEYLVRDACEEASSMDELKEVVARGVVGDDPCRGKRKEYAELLDYGRDGRATERACHAILELHKGTIRHTVAAEQKLLVYVPESLSGREIKQGLDEIRLKTAGRWEIIACGPSMRTIGGEGKKVRCVHMKEITPRGLARILGNRPSGPVGFVVCGCGTLPWSWNRMMVNHFLWNKNTAVVSAICTPQSADPVLEVCCPEMQDSSPRNKANFFKFITVGESIILDTLLSTCFLFDSSLLQDAPDMPQGWHGLCDYLTVQAQSKGKTCRMACDTYVY